MKFCINIFIYYRIWLANILLNNLTQMLLRNTGIQFCFIVITLPSHFNVTKLFQWAFLSKQKLKLIKTISLKFFITVSYYLFKAYTFFWNFSFWFLIMVIFIWFYFYLFINFTKYYLILLIFLKSQFGAF